MNRGRFFVFGEVFSADPAFTSRYSTRGGMDATLDFPFQDAARAYAGGRGGAARLSALYAADDHHLDDDLIGTDATHARDNHDPSHPLYRHIAALAALRERHPTLADGAQIERLAQAGLYAFSRIDARQRVEYVVAVNNATAPASARVPTYSPSAPFHQLYGPAPGATAAGQPVTLTSVPDAALRVTVPPMSAVVFRAGAKLSAPAEGPRISLTLPGEEIRGTPEDERVEIRAHVPGDGFDQVTFAAKPVKDRGGCWGPTMPRAPAVRTGYFMT
ncbi:hypothetical protein ACIBEJ_01900 [Nonomuraea sp. NPDC050790]|uniref:hypothetical protein n=1 Tax=Nonomuraea sp. NPDC050790 TaxID=3364371 RepID=UPI0037995A62